MQTNETYTPSARKPTCTTQYKRTPDPIRSGHRRNITIHCRSYIPAVRTSCRTVECSDEHHFQRQTRRPDGTSHTPPTMWTAFSLTPPDATFVRGHRGKYVKRTPSSRVVRMIFSLRQAPVRPRIKAPAAYSNGCDESTMRPDAEAHRCTPTAHRQTRRSSTRPRLLNGQKGAYQSGTHIHPTPGIGVCV
jgi:hypothetical protein